MKIYYNKTNEKSLYLHTVRPPAGSKPYGFIGQIHVFIPMKKIGSAKPMNSYFFYSQVTHLRNADSENYVALYVFRHGDVKTICFHKEK